jgi:hypothetical protein
MARVKYAPAVAPLFNGTTGYTFMPNPQGQSMKTNARPRHMRSDWQLEKMAMFTSIARIWRTLSQIEKDAWYAWVNYLPQQSNRVPSITIAAFQNYQKRNFYKYLTEGSDFVLMVDPQLVTYEEDLPVYTSELVNGRLILTHTFTRGNGDLVCSIFIKSYTWSSVNTPRSLDRSFINIPNITGSTDVTEQCIDYFGFVPKEKDSLLIRTVQAGIDNGQFFYPEVSKIIVGEQINPCLTSLYDGIIAYYKLLETSGQVIDSLGLHNLDLTLGVARGISGLLGNCYQFNGIDAWCFGVSPLQGLNICTISAWINYDSDAWYGLPISGEFVSSTSPTIAINSEATGFQTGTPDITSSGLPVITTTPNTWYLVTLQFYTSQSPTGSYYCKHSVNLNFQTTFRHQLGTYPNSFGVTLTFGAYQLWGYYFLNRFKGRLSNVLIHNRLLSDCEITAYYNNGLGLILDL